MNYDPTEGNNFGQNALISAGKFFNGLGLRARQLMGDKEAQSLIDEHKKLDAPLMNTWGGLSGYTGAGILSTAALMRALGPTGRALLEKVPGASRFAAAHPET